MKRKSLIEFAENNAKEIKALGNKYEMQMAMSSQRTCVLRPLLLPRFTKLLMTPKEKREYIRMACRFTRYDNVDTAVQWVKDWVNK